MSPTPIVVLDLMHGCLDVCTSSKLSEMFFFFSFCQPLNTNAEETEDMNDNIDRGLGHIGLNHLAPDFGSSKNQHFSVYTLRAR